jgi:hypothetical protein
MRQKEWIAMRKFALMGSLVVVALALLATTAWADPPTHLKNQTFSDTFSAPAGQLCDFNYFQAFTIVYDAEIFGDPANPTKLVAHQKIYVTHTNLDTGYSLTEVDTQENTIDLVNNVGKTVGIFWHLRDPNGKLVVVQSGQILYDAFTGDIIKITPSVDPSFAAVICPALGGAPAI